MSALVFLDTETTGLALDDDIWEVAAVRREPDGTETELHLFVEHDTEKCLQLPESFLADHRRRFPVDGSPVPRHEAAERITEFFAGRPHVVGAVPNFDTERIAWMCEEFLDWRAPWHYHLIDVENLAVGYLAAQGIATPLPWDSDALSAAIGVSAPVEERHTAMGDVRWAMRIYDAVTSDADLIHDALEVLYERAPDRRPQIEAELRRRGWWQGYEEEN